jgi:hypothetical protein
MIIFFIALSLGSWIADLRVMIVVSDIQRKHVECQMTECESW